jgi:hypothetical protein
MKTLRRLSFATLLSLIIAGSVFAGHIETPAAPAPPPATSTSTSSVITAVAAILSLIR